MTYNKETLANSEQRTRGCGDLCRIAACLAVCLFVSVQVWAQTGWQTEVVARGGGADIGTYPTLAIDNGGNFHVTYYDATHHALLYGFRAKNDKRWFNMAVAPKNVGPFSSLAVDKQGHPHITWVSRYEDGLHYGYYDGKIWHTLVVDPAKIDYFNCIQLDANGHPRISYYLYHGEGGVYILKLKYAYFDGNNWFIQTVDKRMSTGKFNSIAVDSAGNPHIAYAHVGLGDLLYAYWDGKSWQLSDADSRRNHNAYVGIGNSIALDSKGNPHIAYFDISNLRVKYAYWDGKKWEVEAVSQLQGHAELDHVSIKLDSTDRPHIAFYESGNGVLKYAVRKADAKAVVEDATQKTSKPKITIDKPVEEAHQAEGLENWNVEIVDQEANVGMNPSLALDASGLPHIAYYDATNQSLKVAHKTAASAPPSKAEAAITNK